MPLKNSSHPAQLNPDDQRPFDLTAHARSAARGRGAHLGFIAITSFLILGVLLIALESLRYFDASVKLKLLLILGIISSAAGVGIGIYYWLLRTQKLPETRPEQLAREIGLRLPQVGDRLVNAVQLQQVKPEDGISDTLQAAAVAAGQQVIQDIPSGMLFPGSEIKRNLKRLGLGLVVVLILYAVNFSTTTAALTRLAHPTENFAYPLPLQLQLFSPVDQVLVGDTVMISGTVSGRAVSQVQLIIRTKKDTASYLLTVQEQKFELPLDHLMNSFTAVARVRNQRLWEPWEQVESAPLRIQVINRPLVQSLTIRVKPPAYTQLPTEVYQHDIMAISGLLGSRVSLEGLASKVIQSATLHFQKTPARPISLEGASFRTDFRLEHDDRIWITLTDDEGVTNLDPLEYPIYVAGDVAPLIRVLVPGEDVILGEKMQIPLRLKLDDDFGFSKLRLFYHLQHPDYLQVDTTLYVQVVQLPHQVEASLEFNYLWDLNDIAIMPEDAIEYWFTVWDNNTVSGPQQASSKKWLARLPSLDEMFTDIAQGNEQVKQEQEDVLDLVKEVKEKVAELALEVQKDPNLSWEQQQEATESMDQVKNLKDQLEEISKQLDQMISSAEDQNLFSDETLDKYAELQQLMDELVTPELKAAMERLQEAMDQKDPREMQAALEDFQAEMENFQKSVERTLEIFKQVELEQKIDELTTRLNDLADRQASLSQDLSESEASEAANQEAKISDDFDQATQTSDELQQLLDQNQELSSAEVQDLQEQMQDQQIGDNLEQATGLMEQGQMSQAQPPADAAAQSLRQMANQSQQIRSNLQQQMMDQVMSEFHSALLKSLRLSQTQEDLEQPTARSSRQSSLLRDYADTEMDLMQGLQQLAAELKTLGNKTFAVSPAQGRALGSVQAHMQQAINDLEARNPRKSAQAQALARESLNRLARQLANSMESLQQSGESSGFSDYMQQLQQMAGQQQGLNQQTMLQLGMGNPSMMQQLAQQQMQLRQSLSQIEQGMGSDSRMLGDLGKIGAEMEEVAKALRSKRPSQQIHDQQERILSRLLDAQRSATQRDFSKKRKSKTGQNDPAWLGARGLPEDRGAARNKLYEELIFSLKQDYTREEQTLIREYFNQLEAELNE